MLLKFGMMRSKAADDEPSAVADAANDHYDEQFMERAAIAEIDGGIHRGWAEVFAWLNPDCPPPDVSIDAWRELADEFGFFLGRPLLGQAIEAGWQPQDLLLGPGLLRLLAGERISDLVRCAG
jgi:hypothetical protein